jgi:hypothetical protein
LVAFTPLRSSIWNSTRRFFAMFSGVSFGAMRLFGPDLSVTDSRQLGSVSMCARNDETPSQEFKAMRLANDGDRLRRRDVEARRKFGHLVEQEDFTELIGRCRKSGSAAHA